MELKKLKGVKGVSMLHLVVVLLMSGLMIIYTFLRVADNNARREIERTMPKTYEYIEPNSSTSLVQKFCKKITESNEMVSDEVCYNRLRTFENCKNKINNKKDSDELEKLVSLIENEQQAETIINKCQTYKQENTKEEIAKNETPETPKNDEKINEILNSLF